MSSLVYATTDKTIRKVLTTQLNLKYQNYGDSAIIPELTLTNTGTRADITLVNGILHGYELKGDRDTLSRLPRQIDGYNSVFDKVTIVVGKKHLVHTIQMVPDWWGVILAKSNGVGEEPLLIELRKASKNQNQNIKTVLQLLWKSELIDLLKKKSSHVGLSNLNKDEVVDVIVSSLDKQIIKDFVRMRLVRRSKH